VIAPGAVRERIVQAAATLKDGRLDAALESLRAAADTWPDSTGDSSTPRARLLESPINRGKRSIEHLRKAIALAPGDERARVTAG
jgi:hypothetical protein